MLAAREAESAGEVPVAPENDPGGVDNTSLQQQPSAAADAASARLPAGWRLALALAPDADGELGGTAELWQGGQMRCRVVIARYGTDRAAAEARVHARIEYWLAEWLARPHTGDTGFADLEP